MSLKFEVPVFEYTAFWHVKNKERVDGKDEGIRIGKQTSKRVNGKRSQTVLIVSNSARRDTY